MATMISEEAAILCVNTLTELLDAEGDDPAQIIIWGGPVPAAVNDPVDGSCQVLATFELPATTFGVAAVNGVNVEALMNPAVAMTVLGEANGTATFCRFYNGLGDAVLQADVGLADSGALVILNTLTIHTAEDVTIGEVPILQMPIR